MTAIRLSISQRERIVDDRADLRRRALMSSPLVGPLPEHLAGELGDLEDARDANKSAIDRAYWTFSRCARGGLVSPALYTERAWIAEAIRREREHLRQMARAEEQGEAAARYDGPRTVLDERWLARLWPEGA